MGTNTHCMDDHRNSTDIELLRSDHRGLLIRYQETIGIIVHTYIRSGMFHASEADDITQQINTELLEKLPRISAQFNGSTLVRTYLSSIIRHACLNLHKKRHAGPAFVDIEEVPPPVAPGHPDHHLGLDHTVRVLRAILSQFHTDRPKLMVCLKTMYRIPLTREEVLTWWPACPHADLDAILAASHGMDHHLTDKQAFALIHPFVMKRDRTAGSFDSLRRWTDEHITQIISLLNGSPPAAAHTKETLGILLEDHMAPFPGRR